MTRRSGTGTASIAHEVPDDAVLAREGDYCLGIGFEVAGVAIPEDVADPDLPKASGRVQLPDHIGWVPRKDRTYDLDKPYDRLVFYESLLGEATPDEVRWYIRVEELVAMWGRLLIPSHVQYAWGLWLRDQGLLA